MSQIIQGDAYTILRTLPSNLVQTVVTSPPYYGLRDYAVEGQIGLEQTPEEYTEKLVRVFREVRRVLRNDGTLWLNLGDSYKDKQLLGIPWKVAFALQSDNWILRSDIVWLKSNAMPESVTDRPTKAHEYVFLFSKQGQYFYDACSIKAQETRNKRSVWSIPTFPFPGAHFAVMAPELARTCILAGSTDKACEYCDAAWERVIVPTGHKNQREIAHVPNNAPTKTDSTSWKPTAMATDKLQPACTCPDNTGSGKSIVLDPFSGAGTTAFMAARLGREYIGIELNPEYVTMSQKRLARLQTGLWGFSEVAS